MPPQSRAQRRRQAARQQQRPDRQAARSTPRPRDAGAESSVAAAAEEYTDEALPALEPAAAAAPQSTDVNLPPPASRSGAARTARRARSRPVAEPVDYRKDYAAALRDLRWIAIWAALLFIAMIALRFSGLV